MFMTDEERNTLEHFLADRNTECADIKVLKQCYYADQLDWLSGLNDDELLEELG